MIRVPEDKRGSADYTCSWRESGIGNQGLTHWLPELHQPDMRK